MGESTPCNVEQINSAFIEAPEALNPIIANKSLSYTAVYRNLIERGTFEYGKGYTQYSQTFHGGSAIQDAGASWSAMQAYRAPGTNGAGDPGYDPCKYQSEVIGYGFTKKSYTVYEAHRRTLDICLTDILFDWQYEQQLTAIYESLSNVTLGEWEQIERELYLYFCTKYFVQASATGLGLENFTMGMFADHVDIPVTGLGDIGRLNQSVLNRIYSYLSRQAADAALAGNAGTPIFGLVTSMETSDEVIKLDMDVAGAFGGSVIANYNFPNVPNSVPGYGTPKVYKGYSHLFDPAAPRFKVNAVGDELERVWPFEETPTTIGSALNIAEEYILAPFEISVILIKNVYKALVPPPNPTSLAGGYKFDPADNFGEFEWMNFRDRCDNPKGEKGYFDARFRIAPEPLLHSTDAICLLHRRCNELDIEPCGTCWVSGTDAIAVSACAQFDTTKAAADATEYLVTLASCLPCDIGQNVTVTFTGGSTLCAVIADDFAAPTYKIVFAEGVAGGHCDYDSGMASIDCDCTRGQ